jgi:hypothetical protein
MRLRPQASVLPWMEGVELDSFSDSLKALLASPLFHCSRGCHAAQQRAFGPAHFAALAFLNARHRFRSAAAIRLRAAALNVRFAPRALGVVAMDCAGSRVPSCFRISAIFPSMDFRWT